MNGSRTGAALLVLVIASCASATPQPQIPPIYDSLIVLGHRVGPVSLGMSESQLLNAAGEPTSKTDYSAFRAGRAGYIYNKLGISLIVQDGSVVQISPTDNRYSTASGIRVGAPMPANAGAGASTHESHGVISYCFDGRSALTVRGKEDAMTAPDCAVGAVCDVVIGECALAKRL